MYGFLFFFSSVLFFLLHSVVHISCLERRMLFLIAQFILLWTPDTSLEPRSFCTRRARADGVRGKGARAGPSITSIPVFISRSRFIHAFSLAMDMRQVGIFTRSGADTPASENRFDAEFSRGLSGTRPRARDFVLFLVSGL